MTQKRTKTKASLTLRRPPDLSDPARKVWDRVIATHDHLGPADQHLLGQYCELAAQLDQVIELSKASGPLAISEKDREYLSPAYQALAMLQPKVWKMARDLRIVTATRPKPMAKPADTIVPRYKVTG
jgi:phage terminase small subunit